MKPVTISTEHLITGLSLAAGQVIPAAWATTFLVVKYNRKGQAGVEQDFLEYQCYR